MKLTDIILEQNQLTLGDLEFGVNVQKGDSLPNPNEDALRGINGEYDLKDYLSDKDLSLSVIIDRSQPWFKVFTVPAFEKGREEFMKGKAAYLDRERKAGRTGGLD